MAKVDVKQCVLDVVEEIIGLTQEDMLANMDMNLREEGLLDSVSSASLVVHLEQRLHKKINVEKLETNDFNTLNSIIAFVKRVTKL